MTYKWIRQDYKKNVQKVTIIKMLTTDVLQNISVMGAKKRAIIKSIVTEPQIYATSFNSTS